MRAVVVLVVLSLSECRSSHVPRAAALIVHCGPPCGVQSAQPAMHCAQTAFSRSVQCCDSVAVSFLCMPRAELCSAMQRRVRDDSVTALLAALLCPLDDCSGGMPDGNRSITQPLQLPDSRSPHSPLPPPAPTPVTSVPSLPRLTPHSLSAPFVSLPPADCSHPRSLCPFRPAFSPSSSIRVPCPTAAPFVCGLSPSCPAPSLSCRVCWRPPCCWCCVASSPVALLPRLCRRRPRTSSRCPLHRQPAAAAPPPLAATGTAMACRRPPPLLSSRSPLVAAVVACLACPM